MDRFLWLLRGAMARFGISEFRRPPSLGKVERFQSWVPRWLPAVPVKDRSQCLIPAPTQPVVLPRALSESASEAGLNEGFRSRLPYAFSDASVQAKLLMNMVGLDLEAALNDPQRVSLGTPNAASVTLILGDTGSMVTLATVSGRPRPIRWTEAGAAPSFETFLRRRRIRIDGASFSYDDYRNSTNRRELFKWDFVDGAWDEEKKERRKRSAQLDCEKKLLEVLAAFLEDRYLSLPPGSTVILYSQHPICPSCAGVIAQFEERLGIKIRIVGEDLGVTQPYEPLSAR